MHWQVLVHVITRLTKLYYCFYLFKDFGLNTTFESCHKTDQPVNRLQDSTVCTEAPAFKVTSSSTFPLCFLYFPHYFHTWVSLILLLIHYRLLLILMLKNFVILFILYPIIKTFTAHQYFVLIFLTHLIDFSLWPTIYSPYK